ncbi:hypothetical protein ACFQT0_26070 [Hymenobacter humi]|uniref:Uncharacterized protein n=1 Tax=Hymenobacter humi TaxID=1411620 RepID=A0ABW2UC93_9BACT
MKVNGKKTALPPVATPDLSQSFDRDTYFQPVSWFYSAFGVLPRREIYQLASAEARQTILDALAKTYDLEQATVAHAVYLDKKDKAPDISHYALCLAPHLLLWFYERGTYGDRAGQPVLFPADRPHPPGAGAGALGGPTRYRQAGARPHPSVAAGFW